MREDLKTRKHLKIRFHIHKALFVRYQQNPFHETSSETVSRVGNIFQHGLKETLFLIKLNHSLAGLCSNDRQFISVRSYFIWRQYKKSLSLSISLSPFSRLPHSAISLNYMEFSAATVCFLKFRAIKQNPSEFPENFISIDIFAFLTHEIMITSTS